MNKTIRVILFIIISFVIFLVGLYVYAFFSPKLEIKNRGKIFIYDDKENLMYQGSGSSEWISLDDISPDLINAVISVEDKNFYKHQGFDFLRIIKAISHNIRYNTLVGASTISQQYIKNLFLSFDQTWERKIEEAFLTIELEVHYTKKEILEGYLNTINYGEGNYGIEDASKYYFNKSSKDLSLEEAIMLAGIPKSPSNYNPVSDYEACIKRAKTVAMTMVKNGYITSDEEKKLFTRQIPIYGKRSEKNLEMIMYYQDAVLSELASIKQIPSSFTQSSGLKIYTTFDSLAQESMEQAILKHMNMDDDLQVASMIIDPKTGGVKALSGGKNYAKSQFNRALMAKRQVGSTIKPLLYYAALENGLTSSSLFKSERTTFYFDNGKTYSPRNYNDIYANKDITMAAAIAYSDNIYAVKTHLFLGTDVLIKTAKEMGINESLEPNPSLALGTSELSMIDYASAYTTLAGGGDKKDIHFISRIEDMDGHVLYKFKSKYDYILNYNDVFIINELLTNTTNSEFKSYTTPTALSLASKMSRKYSLKTGTTNTDSWVCGYNPDALMMVWVGHDDASEIDNKASIISKNIWLDGIENYLKDTEQNWYQMPSNVVGVFKNGITGQNPLDEKNRTLLYYVKGTNIMN